MWESKDQTLDVNYNTDHIWFDGINGLPVQKPAEIRSGASSWAAEIASSREGLIMRATDLSAITPVPSLSLDRVIAHL